MQGDFAASIAIRLGRLKDVSESCATFEYPLFAEYVKDVGVDVFASKPDYLLPSKGRNRTAIPP
jgi:hypothetical protein